MKYHLAVLALLVSLGVAAQSTVQKSMLDTFVKYASIDSQSNYDSISTQGQRNMATPLSAAMAYDRRWYRQIDECYGH